MEEKLEGGCDRKNGKSTEDQSEIKKGDREAG